jgi:hypothetical protein
MDTDMQKEIRENPSVHRPTQEYFLAMKAENKYVDANVSADVLCKILHSGTYSSGAHVDYYDVAPTP